MAEAAQRILDTQPPMLPESVFYWRAFMELGTDRPPAMSGPTQIPLTAIRAYCDELELSWLEREHFKRIIMALDNRRAVLIHRNSQKDSAK